MNVMVNVLPMIFGDSKYVLSITIAQDLRVENVAKYIFFVTGRRGLELFPRGGRVCLFSWVWVWVGVRNITF